MGWWRGEEGAAGRRYSRHLRIGGQREASRTVAEIEAGSLQLGRHDRERHHPEDLEPVPGQVPVLDELEVYLEAARLSAASGKHVFDTLYHAVALRRRGASLVTADGRYYRHARRAGRVLLLQDFVVPTG